MDQAMKDVVATGLTAFKNGQSFGGYMIDSEDETTTVVARSNEGTFIGTLTVQAREFMWSVQRPSGSRRRLPPVFDRRPGKKIADHEVISHP